jgi:hypothetical protein
MARVAWGRAKRVRNAASAAAKAGSSEKIIGLFEPKQKVSGRNPVSFHIMV